MKIQNEYTADEIIMAVKSRFNPGFEIKGTFNDKIATTFPTIIETFPITIYYNGKHFSLNNKTGYKQLAKKYFMCGRAHGFTNYQDPNFTINANKIADTHFIASEGPQNLEDVDALFANTLFNKKIPITQIVALGSCLSLGGSGYQDFYEYILRERTNEVTGTYRYTIDKKSQIGSYSSNTAGDGRQFYPNSIVQSRLLVQKNEMKNAPRALDITLIPISDNATFNLAEDKDNTLKEALWKTYNKSRNENLLIHCASGIGRTGHLILIMELLKHYKEIYEAENIDVASDKILEIINRIRAERFSLIQVKEQFTDAIRIAQVLYKYGLAKGYVKDDAVALVSKRPQTFFTRLVEAFTKDAKDITCELPHRKTLNSGR